MMCVIFSFVSGYDASGVAQVGGLAVCICDVLVACRVLRSCGCYCVGLWILRLFGVTLCCAWVFTVCLCGFHCNSDLFIF